MFWSAAYVVYNMCQKCILRYSFIFVYDTATTEIYTYGHSLSLHDALPILHEDQTAFGPTRLLFHIDVGHRPSPVGDDELASGGHVGAVASFLHFLDPHLAFRKYDRHFAAVHADFEGRADGAHPLTGCGNREGPGGIVRALEEGAADEQFDEIGRANV